MDINDDNKNTNEDLKDYEVLKLKDVIHQLEVIFASNDVIAFFCVCLSLKSFEDYVEYLPTVVELDKGMTNEERIKLGKAVITLGQGIRNYAAGRNNPNEDQNNL